MSVNQLSSSIPHLSSSQSQSPPQSQPPSLQQEQTETQSLMQPLPPTPPPPHLLMYPPLGFELGNAQGLTLPNEDYQQYVNSLLLNPHSLPPTAPLLTTAPPITKDTGPLQYESLVYSAPLPNSDSALDAQLYQAYLHNLQSSLYSSYLMENYQPYLVGGDTLGVGLQPSGGEVATVTNTPAVSATESAALFALSPTTSSDVSPIPTTAVSLNENTTLQTLNNTDTNLLSPPPQFEYNTLPRFSELTQQQYQEHLLQQLHLLQIQQQQLQRSQVTAQSSNSMNSETPNTSNSNTDASERTHQNVVDSMAAMSLVDTQQSSSAATPSALSNPTSSLPPTSGANANFTSSTSPSPANSTAVTSQTNKLNSNQNTNSQNQTSQQSQSTQLTVKKEEKRTWVDVLNSPPPSGQQQQQQTQQQQYQQQYQQQQQNQQNQQNQQKQQKQQQLLQQTQKPKRKKNRQQQQANSSASQMEHSLLSKTSRASQSTESRKSNNQTAITNNVEGVKVSSREERHIRKATKSSRSPVPAALYFVNANKDDVFNPDDFDTEPSFARFFVIKSYSEDDVHKSIKYGIWASTDTGNKRLDTAYRQSADKGPIYLFFSVNMSGQFCGMAQMISPVDYKKKSEYWTQDKWNGIFQVKWIFVKDIPNNRFRHICLANNENKPVTNSRDTQEVPLEPGKEMLKIFKNFQHTTCLLDDFEYYNKRQELRDSGIDPDSLDESSYSTAAVTVPTKSQSTKSFTNTKAKANAKRNSPSAKPKEPPNRSSPNSYNYNYNSNKDNSSRRLQRRN
jgi:hypothetical protein